MITIAHANSARLRMLGGSRSRRMICSPGATRPPQCSRSARARREAATGQRSGAGKHRRLIAGLALPAAQDARLAADPAPRTRQAARRGSSAVEASMRIASLLPSATEILFASGAGGDVVGVTDECDYPPAAALPALTSSAIDH